MKANSFMNSNDNTSTKHDEGSESPRENQKMSED